MSLPKIEYEPLRLYNFYYQSYQISKADIQRGLKCCFHSADKLFNATKEHMKQEGIPQYHPQRVLVDNLFKVYGWDIKRIKTAVKALELVNEEID